MSTDGIKIFTEDLSASRQKALSAAIEPATEELDHRAGADGVEKARAQENHPAPRGSQ
jgi:hypothetical protein